MNNNSGDETFEPLVHEKKLSELYQNSLKLDLNEPSVKVSAEILQLAKQQLSETSNQKQEGVISKERDNTTKNSSNRRDKGWQWPFSLVASVGMLGVLVATQKDFFFDPMNTVSEDSHIQFAPLMAAPATSLNKREVEELTAEPSFLVLQQTASKQKDEELAVQKFSAKTSKRVSINQTPKLAKEQMLNRSMLETNSAKTSPMSLFEMSKLASILKLELAIESSSDHEENASIDMMQKTLFEHLSEYQKNHVDFEISEKYLSVLKVDQVQQLKSTGAQVDPKK